MPWSRRLWLYRNGFASSRGAMYDISQENVDDYLSDADWTKTRHVVQPYESGLMIKPLFHRLLADDYSHLLPTAYGLVRNGQFLRPSGFDEELDSVDDIATLARQTQLVVKPVDGGLGRDVHVIGFDDGNLTVDGRPMRDAELTTFLDDLPESIVVEYVHQADYAADIFPNTANTVRVLSMIDTADDQPFIAAAVHRFGTTGSEPVDNAHAGGVFAGIDTHTGELKPVLTAPATGAVRQLTAHPDTGVEITGNVVPAWEDIREQILDLAAEFGWMWPMVGWDIVVTGNDGSLVILEGNERSAIDFHQAYEPLLADNRIRRFYEYHDVI